VKRGRRRRIKKRGILNSMLQTEFDKRIQSWEQLRNESAFILERELKSAKIKYHSLTSRIKTFESFAAKAVRQRFTDPFAEVTDVVGLRVVCLFLSDIEKIASVIGAKFEILEQDNKIEGQQVATFGYLSLHFSAQMKSTYSGPRYDEILGIPFEIQVRTIAMDAWAATSHYLDYKSESDVPSDLRRDFYALSGLFYVADRHFEMFFKSRQAVREEIKKTMQHDHPRLDQELNFDSLDAYLRSKFPDRRQGDSEHISIAVEELKRTGISTISTLDEMITKHWNWFMKHEALNPPQQDESSDETGPFAAVGVVRVIADEIRLGRLQRSG
jgi:putative GTP pyrophosphokinase